MSHPSVAGGHLGLAGLKICTEVAFVMMQPTTTMLPQLMWWANHNFCGIQRSLSVVPSLYEIQDRAGSTGANRNILYPGSQ